MTINSDGFGSEYDSSHALFIKSRARIWDSPFRRLYANGLKRPFDLLISLIALVPALLIILPFAFLISLDGGAPFFIQKRIGKGGKIFPMFKLRSMAVNAEQKLETYLQENPELRAEWDADQKLKNDPRVTGVGKFIRRSSIDELPQIFNVILGDMSLVGPRPMMEDQRFLNMGNEYLLMRPGITGEWQVSARNEVDFAARAGFDRRYYHRISFLHDLKIMFRTVGVVFAARGC